MDPRERQRIINNVQLMVDKSAPVEHIDGYLADEDLTPASFRALLTASPAPAPGAASGAPRPQAPPGAALRSAPTAGAFAAFDDDNGQSAPRVNVMGIDPAANGTAPPGPPAPSTGAVLLDSVKQGAAQGVGFLGSVAARFNPLNYVTASRDPDRTINDVAHGVGHQAQTWLEDKLGVKGVQPTNTLQRAVAAGGQAVGDPLSYMLPGGGVVTAARQGKVAASAVGLVSDLLGGFLGGAGAEVGGEIGEKQFGAAGRVAGTLLGGVAGGMASRDPQTRAAAEVAVPQVQRFIADRARAAPGAAAGALDKASDLRSSAAVRNLMEAASAADPVAVERLAAMKQLAERTGVQLPIGAADNAVLNQAIAQRAATDPAFRAKYQTQVDTAETAIRSKATETLGDAGQAHTRLTSSVTSPGGSALDALRTQSQQSAAKASQQLTASILKEADIDPQALGARTVALVERQEVAARKAVAPLYDEAFEAAGNVKPSQEAIGALKEAASSLNDAAFLRTLPVEARRLVTRLAEGVEKPQAHTLVGPNGKPLMAAPAAKAPFSLADLDHAKRTINKAVREAPPGSDRWAALSQLKSAVDETIDGLPGEFAGRYRAADKAYREAVGLPFDAAALRQMDRAKFDESVVPLITRNQSAAEQFIRVGGDEAKGILRAALLGDLAKRAKDGVLSPEAVESWLKSPKGKAAAALPELAKDLAHGKDQLLLARTAAEARDAAYAAKASRHIVDGYGKSLSAVGQDLLASPANVNRYLSTHATGANPDALRALQSIGLETALQQPAPLQWLLAPGRREATERLFGDRMPAIRDLAEAQEALSKAKVSGGFDLSSLPTDLLERHLGVSAPSVLSTMRNQIWSPIHKIATLSSKALANVTDKREAAAIANALLDGPGLQAHIAAVKAAGGKGALNPEEYIKAMSTTERGKAWLLNIGRAVVDHQAGGIQRGAAIGALQEARGQDIRNQDNYGAPTLPDLDIMGLGR